MTPARRWFVLVLLAVAGAACGRVTADKPKSAVEKPVPRAQGEADDSPGLREHPH
jgi:hypothetical protein